MKYIFIIPTFLLICSCHWLKSEKEAITPEEVAVAFCQGLTSLDFDKAARYSEKETAKLIENMSDLVSKMMPKHERDKSIKKAKFIQAATCTITGNTALCRVCCDENGLDTNEVVTLRLQDDGKWRAFIDKGAAASPPEEE